MRRVLVFVTCLAAATVSAQRSGRVIDRTFGHLSEEILVSNTSAAYVAPIVLAHPGGARVVWLDADDIRLLDLDRDGDRVRDPVTIAHGAQGFVVAQNGVDTLIAWNADDSTIVAAFADREGRVASSFPVATGAEISVSGAACITSECAIAWSFPAFGFHFANAGFVARFSPSGSPIGAPVVMPANTHRPSLVASDRDYLVILQSYDIGRPVFGAIRFSEGVLRESIGFGGRTVGAFAAWNGREWLAASLPMGPYSSIHLRLTRIDATGNAHVAGEYTFDPYRHASDLVWNGRAWIIGLISNEIILAAELHGERTLRGARIAIPIANVAGDWPFVAMSSAGDGTTWFAYRRGSAVFVRFLD